MTALALLACVPIVMWLVQTALLRWHRLPIRLRIDAGDAPPIVRAAGRIVTPVSLMAVAVVYPLIRGENPFDYFARLLPLDSRLEDVARGSAATVLFLCALYLVWLLTGQMRISPHPDRRRIARRIAVVPFSAILGSVVEELVFRGVVMADLQRIESLGSAGAVTASALVFAGAHYVRSAKRHWTVAGHVILGYLLSVAFWRTENLWLAIGLHAGGILMIMGSRPILKYRGPAWLTGASIYPYAGVVGAIGLTMLTGMIAR